MNFRLGVALGSLALAVVSSAQSNGWFFECIDPMNTAPYSPDYGFNQVETELMRISVGASGTVTYGGQNGPCYAPNSRTLDAAGRLAFQVGNIGTIQSDNDNNMALTVGAPFDPVGDYVFGRILKTDDDGGDSALFGDGGLRVTFVGASRRYIIASWNDADVDVELEVRGLGDAARLRWRMTNLQEDAAPLGLLFACYPGMHMSGFARDPETGANQAFSLLGSLSGNPKNTADNYIGWAILPGQRPIRTERRYASNSLRFPDNMRLMFGQGSNFGMHVDNVPPEETPDATGTDLVRIGNHVYTSFDNNINLRVFGDPPTNPNPAEEADIFLRDLVFVQRFPTQSVGAGLTREVIHYVRQTSFVSDYSGSYTVCVDAPKLISTDPADPQSFEQNPFTVRVWIDNQYANVDKEVPLNNAQVRIFLPDGMTLAPGETQTKTIGSIAANALGFVDYVVEVDNETVGTKQIRVTVTAPPGENKELVTDINVSATPRLDLPVGANLVTLPYTFEDSSFDQVFGLQTGIDFQVFRFDPLADTFRPAESAERGRGYWVVPTSDLGNYVLSNARQPNDMGRGGASVTLQTGWNLIGNPYSYAVPLRELNAVYADDPGTVFSLAEIVSQGIVSSSLVSWDRSDGGAGQLAYTSTSTGTLLPHVGYWIYHNGFQPIRLIFPPVFAEGLPGTGRSEEEPFVQNDRNWRLQLAVRGNGVIDSQNYVGQLRDTNDARVMSMPKPPTAPGQTAEIRIRGDYNGTEMNLSRAFSARVGRQEWKVEVKATEPGEYTITWPNLPSLPRGVRFRLEDKATGEVRDLRSLSGYTFRANEAGTRSFTLVAEPGGSSRAVIGNVVVTRPTRDANAPLTINYALSADAQVSVRILSSTGREVFTLSRGRAESAGENTVTWQLRDNANRAVAPGVYRVEILAETSSGERVRRIVPVNVVR
ncbi:MAG: hypothetical protein KF812_01615 [Fimbriimonadaceae bacterium]|nr:hypothetical protein [Fimbriimonadaceae bacterium]